ncbi:MULTISPECIES: DDE-type integrase/transposase/recombinase [Flavobacterium]|uniref:DDE-type integrase/transposase/recombinase n=1 Tax=Flavobacterium TaxID=237 RepID=UPI0016147335
MDNFFKPASYIVFKIYLLHALEAGWLTDETYTKVKVVWCYLYLAVDNWGNTVHFIFTRRRERMSAQSFLIKSDKKITASHTITTRKLGAILRRFQYKSIILFILGYHLRNLASKAKMVLCSFVPI